jgi:hypothetical protein
VEEQGAVLRAMSGRYLGIVNGAYTGTTYHPWPQPAKRHTCSGGCCDDVEVPRDDCPELQESGDVWNRLGDDRNRLQDDVGESAWVSPPGDGWEVAAFARRLERSRERHADILERLGEERDRERVRSERSPAEKPCVSVAQPKDTTGTFNKGQGDPTYLGLLEELRQLHFEKSAGYGTAADPLENFNTVAAHSGEPAFVYPVRRAVEKLGRWASLYAQGRLEELGEEHLDVASLLLCAEALRRSSLSRTTRTP